MKAFKSLMLIKQTISRSHKAATLPRNYLTFSKFGFASAPGLKTEQLEKPKVVSKS